MAEPTNRRLQEQVGQVAVVTGGGRGFGRKIAQSLASAGMAVAVVARTADQLSETVALIEAAGGRAIAVPADVTDRHAIERVVQEVENRIGPIDVLVNNAAAWSVIGPIWLIDADSWWRDVEINLRGPFLCARAVLHGMVARGRGRIINVSSNAAEMPGPYYSNYSSSKAALLKFTDDLAKETRMHGISVFAVHPGALHTTITDYLSESPEGQEWMPWFRSEMEEIEPCEHDLRRAIIFLVSGQADRLTGCYVNLEDDDVTEMVSRVEEIEKNDLYKLRVRK